MDVLESPQSTARDTILHNYFQIFATVILYYDHLITSPDEIVSIWRHPRSISARAFFVNRYFAFFGNLAVTILGFKTLPEEVCKRYSFFRQSVLIASQIIVGGILLLRTYALYGRNIRVVIFVVGVILILTGIICWSLVGQQDDAPLHSSGCHIGESEKTGIHIAIAWEALFVYDAMIFIMTIVKTYKARHAHFHGLSSEAKVPLVTLFLRDGAIYFAAMALANLANILSFYIAPPLLKGCMSTFASNLSVTMACRLMLNLHATADIGIMSSSAKSMALTPSNDVFTTWDGAMPLDLTSQRERSISIAAAEEQSRANVG